MSDKNNDPLHHSQRKLEVLNLQSSPLNILTQASSPVPFNTTTPPSQLLSEVI